MQTYAKRHSTSRRAGREIFFRPGGSMVACTAGGGVHMNGIEEIINILNMCIYKRGNQDMERNAAYKLKITSQCRTIL